MQKYIFKGNIMKKIIIIATAALCFAGSSVAVENATGAGAGASTVGAITTPIIVGTAVGLGIAGAVVANGSGTSIVVTCTDGQTLVNGICQDDEVPPEPTCDGSDPLVDGVCTGTTTTVTVTGTGTMTSTITVPVTFTYVPTL